MKESGRHHEFHTAFSGNGPTEREPKREDLPFSKLEKGVAVMPARKSDRRAFMSFIGKAGLGAAAGGGAAAQLVGGTDLDPHWVVTLGKHAGPHPPFVSSSRRLLVPPELSDAPDLWIKRSLEWANYILNNYPPSLDDLPERRVALYRLDEILHIPSAPNKPLVHDFYRMRIERAIDEIERTQVREGIRVWKLYNAGFLVRTRSVSFTFDIVPGPPVYTRGPSGSIVVGRIPGFSVPRPWLRRLVAQSDATFISHRHRDHASREIARMFLEAHKPVVAPEGLWANDPEFAGKLTYPDRSGKAVQSIPLRGGERALKLFCYPGHQNPEIPEPGNTILNNVSLVVTPEEFSVLQTGDQSGPEGPGADFGWLTQIGHYHHVDILLIDGWANDLHRIVRGINPQLVIPAHENEMSHRVSHREAYMQDYERMFGLHYPYLVMAWGENYLYTVPASEKGVLPDED